MMLLVIVAVSLGVRVYAWRWPRGVVSIAGHQLSVLVADTDQHRFQGLSNRDSLENFQGMLFIFPRREQHTMVMREMRFPLDIVWLDGNTIVDIAPQLQPEPDRSEAELTPYPGRVPSTMVLELPAGFAEQNALKVGDRVVVAY